MRSTFAIELKYTVTAKINLRRAFGHIADKHPLGTSSRYVEAGETGAHGKKMRPGVYHFKEGGRKFDGNEKLVSDSAVAKKANELFRHADKELKKLNKKYRRIYGHGRFADACLEVTVCPDGKVEVDLFDVIDGLVDQLSDDKGTEESIKGMLVALSALLERSI